MTFWIQHGYGKGDKVSRLVDTGLVTGGVILSPGDEERGALSSTVQGLGDRSVRVLVDPQFYVHSIQGGQARCHESNGLDFGEVSWFVSPREMEQHVDAVLELSRSLGLTEHIAPAPYLASFNDVWAPISLQYSRAFVDAADAEEAFVSVVAEDAAFGDWDATAQWLDALTTLDCHGVYLLIGHRGRTYPFPWESDRLANVLRVIYALGELNEYEVVWGYADIAGLAGLAAGAGGIATGWYHSLRLWTPQKWIPQTGGRQANPRVFLSPLLSPLEAVGEATSAARSALGPEVFSDGALLRRFRQGDPAWGVTDAWYQHMEALASAATAVNGEDAVQDRVAVVDELLVGADTLLTRLDAAGVAVSPTHHTRINALRRGLAVFVDQERL
ncbi:MAG: hypothetical protein M3404_01650 [Actinomycetota bacterium]|nr:hypothetical protein [Actinomycetota bacterium]